MYQRWTGVLSTLATSRAVPSGAHPQPALADVGDPLPGRVRAGVERGSPGRDVPRGGVPGQVRQVDPAGHGERGHRERGVGGESGDAPRPLARPFPDGPLGVGHGPARRAGLGRVGDQAFLAGAGVDHPQAGDRVVAALAAQEGHPAPVGGDLERAGDAEAEPLGPGLLPREAVRHAPILPAGAPVGSPVCLPLVVPGGCCWSTPTPTTSRSAPARPWPPTPRKAPPSPWSPAPAANWGRSSRRNWRIWPTATATGWGSTGPASWRPPAPRS